MHLYWSEHESRPGLRRSLLHVGDEVTFSVPTMPSLSHVSHLPISITTAKGSENGEDSPGKTRSIAHTHSRDYLPTRQG